jgi:hypothetical protein
MTVYVDSMNYHKGRMVMCHMIADSFDELHAMADAIGLERAWFQAGRIPHYDVSLSKKRLAIENGAIEVTAKELVNISHQKYPPSAESNERFLRALNTLFSEVEAETSEEDTP